MEKVKKEVSKRMEQLVGMNIYNENLMKAINCRVISVLGYVMNVCNLRKGDLEDLNKITKSTLRDKQCHGKHSSDEV